MALLEILRVRRADEQARAAKAAKGLWTELRTILDRWESPRHGDEDRVVELADQLDLSDTIASGRCCKMSVASIDSSPVSFAANSAAS